VKSAHIGVNIQSLKIIILAQTGAKERHELSSASKMQWIPNQVWDDK